MKTATPGATALHTLSSLLLAAATLAACPAHAQQREAQITLETGGLQRGDAFRCRIPVTVHYEGSPSLSQIDVIAKVYADHGELASTGIASGQRPLIRERQNGVAYVPVPLQFNLTGNLCQRIDGLRITFARCVFGERPAENCLDRMGFARGQPRDPLFLMLGRDESRQPKQQTPDGS